MGVRASLVAVTPAAAEITQHATTGRDLKSQLGSAQKKVEEAIAALTEIVSVMPSGSNKTTLQGFITTLT